VSSLDLSASRRHRRSSSACFLSTETAHNADLPSNVVKPPSVFADTSDCANITEPEHSPERRTASRDDLAAARPHSTTGTSSGSLDCTEATGPCAGEEIGDISICCEDRPFVELGSSHLQYPFKLVHGDVEHFFVVVCFGVAGRLWEGG
jgi:hypothetical protein